MKNFALIFLLALAASPAAATTFFLAPASGGGNDSNSGTSASSPWLTPNHAVNCGDTITAAASTGYSASNFGAGKWGAVACPAGNNVAWLICATFDACKISASGQDGMHVSANFWGVQGWEVSTSSSGACFTASPSGGSTIHHIIFANNVANGCFSNGINTFNSGSASVDYITIVGNIIYDAAQGTANCYSGISIYQPGQSDSSAGTHIFVAGNFSYKNSDPSSCAGGAPTDGEGIIFDTFDGSQGGLSAYTAQAVAENNVLLANGGRGFEVFNNRSGSAHAPIYVVHNTLWGNSGDPNQNATYCGEVVVSLAFNTQVSNNLAVTNTADGCGHNPVYAYYVGGGDSTDSVHNTFGYSASGTNDGINNSTGFSYGTGNVFGTNPSLANGAAPGAPNCASTSNVPSCMAAVIADFAPAAAAAQGYGYQSPSPSQTTDALFPAWLCTANLPSGLITLSCGGTSSSAPAPPTNVSVSVN
jgi:hypothetical protein